jgi:sugar transferase (PEP-CTERM/EpsH1 system associated)
MQNGNQVSAPKMNEPPRTVCHISLTLRTGGLEKLLVQFARHHDRDRFNHVFVALRDVGAPAEEIRGQGGHVYVLGEPRGKWHELRRVTRLLSDLGPAVVHTHNLYPFFYGSIAARLAQVPAVIHTRHGVALGDGSSGRILFWSASRLTDRVVSVSEDTARRSAREGHLRAGQGLMIWNGVDTDEFVYRGPRNGSNHLITISRLELIKDLPTLLRAVAIAHRSIPDLHLDVVGDGTQRRNLETLAHSLGLDGSVAFLGERHDIAALLTTAAVFVSSSASEGVSLTLLEAMAVGLPVVATAVGGNPEVVADGWTGELVPADDPEALAAALVRVCGDRERAARMGREGRARVERHFDVRQAIRAYEALYDDVLEADRRM